MLILTRAIGESIVIGENIEIVVLGIQGRKVRYGVQAPREIPVDRKEIAERKRAERERSLET